MTSKVTLSPQSVKTETIYFNHQKLTVVPFKSKITGLTLCLQNANGRGTRVPISDTEVATNANISEFAYFWFEYISADKEYTISVELN